MKKKLALLLVAAFSLAVFAGCGGKEEDNKTAEGSVTINEGKLIMSTESGYPPFEYRDDNGDLVGVDVDIATKVAEKLGVEVEFKDMDFQQALMAAQNGQADLVGAGLVVTEARKQGLDFSEAYNGSANLILRRKDDTNLNTPEDLQGKVIGVQTGTVGDDFAQESKKDGIAKEVKGYKTFPQAIIDLKNSKIDCVIVSKVAGSNFIKEDKELSISDNELFQSDTSIGVKKGNEALLKVINEVIGEMKENGELKASFDKHAQA